jgi:hypothetical protein
LRTPTADELIERGDLEGYEVWCAILALSAKAHLQSSG